MKRISPAFAREIKKSSGIPFSIYRRMSNETKNQLARETTQKIISEIKVKFGSFYNYQNWWARRRGFRNRAEYDKYIQYQRGFKRPIDYLNYLAKKRGFKNRYEERKIKGWR